MRISKKQMLIAGSGLLGVAAVAVLVTGSTFGFFSAQSISDGNTFTSGTVALGCPTTQGCAVTGVLPDQSSTRPCSFQVTYTRVSTADAYLAVDVLVVGGNGSTDALWTGLPTGLQLTLTTGKGIHSFTVPNSTLANCRAHADAGAVGAQFQTASTDGTTCGEVTNDLLSTAAVTPGTMSNLHLNWTLPVSSPSSAQTTTAAVYLVFHAVQSGANALPVGCTTVGAACVPTSTFHWS